MTRVQDAKQRRPYSKGTRHNAAGNSLNAQLQAATRMLAASSESAVLDAEVLLCQVLDKPRAYLRAWPERLLTLNQQEAFQALVERRGSGIPIAYLTGKREFWSRAFLVTSEVLIPRPDTECLIERGLALIPNDRPYAIADLGTGSGIIAITLAAERPFAQVVAGDTSPAALAVARANAERLQTANIRFYPSDWFTGLPRQSFDMIVSNPPYIAADDPHLLEGDVRFEPVGALIAEDLGLADIKTIAEQARTWLAQDGHLLIEHGYNQETSVQAIFNALGYRRVQTYRDLSGQPRLTYGLFQAAE